jgi:hypothetical protein
MTPYRRAQHHRGRNHVHRNRELRTHDDGTVEPCLFCRPQHHANEKTQQHGGLRFRPVVGKLTWARPAKEALPGYDPHEEDDSA